MIVCKFGGSSLADAGQFRKVYGIVRADPGRRFLVPSAPGKRNEADEKVTDLFYACYEASEAGRSVDEYLDRIFRRYDEIIEDLGLNLRLESEFEGIRRLFGQRLGRDYFVSRGEYLNGIILANFLGYEFIDAADVIFFRDDGTFDAEKTDVYLSEKLSHARNAVIPGFYGSTPNGTVKTFPRGGSDITGALVARAAGAELYENWTDVNGYLSASPRLVERPRSVPEMSFHELREMHYTAASVLHEDAIRPVRERGIPIRIKNTNAPEHPGTLITPTQRDERRGLIGVGGRDGYAAVTLQRDRLKRDPRFFRTFAAMLERDGVTPELLPCGVDSVTAVFARSGKDPARLAEVWKKELDAETVETVPDLALVSLVGGGLVTEPGYRARAIEALNEAGVPVLLLEQSADGIHLVLGVPGRAAPAAVKALHKALFE
ncbi:MAG: aspartate kinase [Clostridia bacterium]|nr:aspartate kinase [Clostridia bacterium]